jgi:hypothetical protein
MTARTGKRMLQGSVCSSTVQDVFDEKFTKL